MTTYRAKSCLVFGLIGLLGRPAGAQTPAIEAPSFDTPPAAASPAAVPTDAPLFSSDGRDASFLPPPGLGDSSTAAVSATTSTAPATIAPAAPPTALPPPTGAAAPANSLPPVSMPAVAAMPPAGANGTANVIGQPVESEKLEGIDPDSVGLLSAEDGGLGAAMWKNTPKELVTRVLPDLNLPTASAALNGLAQRLLLTTANVPEGASDSLQTLPSLRVQKLVALGAGADAWKLALLKPDRMDEPSLRLAAEAALVTSEGPNVCAKLPDIIHVHTAPEWQKLQVVCQLRANDTKGAQLSLEVLHTQDVKDDTFFDLAEKNVIGGSKSLPRQLTPLKPLNLALLRLMDLAMPPELYAKPDASSIPELLQAKARDDSLRLALAERAAARGIIGASQLDMVYKSTPFSQDQLGSALNSSETGPRAHALFYQIAANEKAPQRRLDFIIKFLQSLDTVPLNNATARLLADMMGDIAIGNDTNSFSPAIAHIYIIAGKPKEALAWLKQARLVAATAPAVGAELQSFWPLVVLAGLETDSDYGPNLHAWLESGLKDADHDRREQIGEILLLFEAAGYAVPEDVWARMLDVPAAQRRGVVPPVLVLERLRAVSTINHRGETVLLALAAADTGTGPGTAAAEPAVLSSIESVRALRLIGLTADALMLARETASQLLAPTHTGTKP